MKPDLKTPGGLFDWNEWRREDERERRTAPSDKFEKSDHPYDLGYWMRYDGKPMPKRGEARKGWEACAKELASEAEAQENVATKPRR